MPRRPDDAAERPLPPGPRLGALWAAVTYAVATLTLAWPALLGRFLVNPHSDQYIAGFPFREFATEYLRTHGGFPLWNPYLFGGMPYVAAMHGDIFYPTFLLRLALGTDAGMSWGMILHVWLAGLFAYLFLRRIGLGFWGALVGGLAFLMGGNVAGLVSPGHDGKIFLSALLPLVLLLTHRAVRDGRAWAWGALTLAIVAAVLTPHPQLLQYLLLVMGAWALFLAFTANGAGERLPRKVALTRIGLVGLVSLAGLVGGAIQFWPVLEYTPWSPRAGGKGWDHAISYSMPIEELLNTYLPQFSGILDDYVGRNGIHFHSEYLGAAVLVLAALGIGAGAVAKAQRRFWIGVLIVATLWALGGNTPFYYLVYYLVPGTKYFRAPSTMLYVVQFATAVLAAYGVERLLAGRVRPRAAFVALGFGAVMALAATSGVLTTLAANFVPRPEFAQLVERNAANLTLGGWRSFLAVAAVAGVLLGVLRGAVKPVVAAGALVGIVTLDLWSVERHYWMFSDPAAKLYASDPALDYLRTQSDSGRVAPIAIEQMAGTSGFRDPYLGGGDGRADGLMAHDIRSVAGYHGNQLGNYLRFSGWPEGDAAGDWPRQLGNPNFWKLMNVRFLYTNSAQTPIEGATRVAGPVRNAVGTMTYVYRLPGDNPPAWVTPIAVKAADDAVLGTVLDPRFDVRTAAIFDTAAAVQAQAVPTQLPAPLDLTASLTAREPGRIALRLSAPAPAGAALVVSENYYPGWTATVDGRATPVGRADYTLLGVALPAGAREVVLTFTSPRYETGKTITVAVLVLATLATAAGLLLDRRRRAPRSAA